MSDCFDHELDAWESYDQAQDYAESYPRNSSFFNYNPLHYHTELIGVELIGQSPLAFKVSYDTHEFWIPKSLCQKVNWSTCSMWVHTEFIEGKLEELDELDDGNYDD